MVSHKFSNGQTVQARKNPWAALAGAYEIVCRLPVSGGDKQYWAKSLENGDHRVVRESDLVVEFPGEEVPACAVGDRQPGWVPGDLPK
jgi:hypothetical protein